MRLQGKIFISTVSTGKAPEIRNIFEPLGALIVDFPMTRFIESDITPEIQSVLMQIEKYQWVIFTSANGAKYFHHLLSATTGLTAIPRGIKIAVVRPRTALELKNSGRTADYTGTGGTAESLINELVGKKLVHNCNVLFPLGNLAPGTAQLLLSEIANATRINVYRTVKSDISDDSPIDLIRNNSYDLVLFTSPSGVKNFAETLGPRHLDPELRFACIGKVTESAAKKYGLSSTITAVTSTYKGLAKEILNYYYKIKN